MEGSESEAIFESLNLKPQLFINEALNSVDELVDGAFHHFHLEASRLLKTDGTYRSQDLKKGIDYIHNKIQASLDKRLNMWEQYCLRNCFTVPSGFSLPSEDEVSGDDPLDQDNHNDAQVESKLNFLRNKLQEAGRECAQLNQELQELEKKSAMSNHYTSSLNEALQLYEVLHTKCSKGGGGYEIEGDEKPLELVKVASELQQNMEQLKSKHFEGNERSRREMTYDANGAMPECSIRNGLSKVSLDDIQEFIDTMNS